MTKDPFGLYPTRRITLETQLTADQMAAVRDVIFFQVAVDGHLTPPVDRYGSGFFDLVTAVTIGWDAIGYNQLILVVTQGHGDRGTGTIDLAVVPYAAPVRGGGHALHGTNLSFRPNSAASLLYELAVAITAIDGIVPLHKVER